MVVFYFNYLKREKECESVNLRPAKMTTMKYVARFMELDRFIVSLKHNDKKRTKCFKNGLDQNLRRQLAIFPIESYQELYN